MKKLLLGLLAVIFLFTIMPLTIPAHATTTSLGLLIPLYNSPPSAQWTNLIASKATNPTVPMIAIINPDTGPGASAQSNYVNETAALQAAGIVVIGYVPTGYGVKSLASVEANMTNYKNWYGVNGILFDEMSPFAAQVSYYSSLATYAYLTLSFNTTVGNPGVQPNNALIGIFNITNIYENSGMPAPIDINFFYPSTPASELSYVAHSVVSLPSQSTIQSLGVYAKWLFITDGVQPNPYSALPSYWTSEVAILNSVVIVTTTVSTVTVTNTIQTIYAPPSQASLAFWYFDLVLVGAIGGIFLFVTYWFQGDNDDSVQMLLIGIVTGAFVAFTAGMLPIEPLIIMIAAYYVYSLRSEIGSLI